MWEVHSKVTAIQRLENDVNGFEPHLQVSKDGKLITKIHLLPTRLRTLETLVIQTNNIYS
jgi:hypothetical protein